MKRINSVGKWVAPMLVLLISIIIFFYTSTITYKNIGTNELFATVDAITRGYKIKQIIASVVLFIAGYLVAQGTDRCYEGSMGSTYCCCRMVHV